MAHSVKNQSKARFVPVALVAAGLALSIPAAGLAVVQTSAAAELPEDIAYLPFTPAKIDPQLAEAAKKSAADKKKADGSGEALF